MRFLLGDEHGKFMADEARGGLVCRAHQKWWFFFCCVGQHGELVGLVGLIKWSASQGKSACCRTPTRGYGISIGTIGQG